VFADNEWVRRTPRRLPRTILHAENEGFVRTRAATRGLVLASLRECHRALDAPRGNGFTVTTDRELSLRVCCGAMTLAPAVAEYGDRAVSRGRGTPEWKHDEALAAERCRASRRLDMLDMVAGQVLMP